MMLFLMGYGTKMCKGSTCLVLQYTITYLTLFKCVNIVL